MVVGKRIMCVFFLCVKRPIFRRDFFAVNFRECGIVQGFLVRFSSVAPDLAWKSVQMHRSLVTFVCLGGFLWWLFCRIRKPEDIDQLDEKNKNIRDVTKRQIQRFIFVLPATCQRKNIPQHQLRYHGFLVQKTGIPFSFRKPWKVQNGYVSMFLEAVNLFHPECFTWCQQVSY